MNGCVSLSAFLQGMASRSWMWRSLLEKSQKFRLEEVDTERHFNGMSLERVLKCGFAAKELRLEYICREMLMEAAEKLFR